MARSAAAQRRHTRTRSLFLIIRRAVIIIIGRRGRHGLVAVVTGVVVIHAIPLLVVVVLGDPSLLQLLPGLDLLLR